MALQVSRRQFRQAGFYPIAKNNAVMHVMAHVRLALTRRYSALSLVREGLNRQRGWEAAWSDNSPKARYDAIVIGGGGHGLATAYYLAKNHGFTDIALI